eukprot:TRINITY_DN1405_c0_g1_i7.p1 TRINITY_DN1405_c0_g1~~TRINITY_DN1405_c0_g1_i7.p1  ORF type:complete len:306 (-),score=63.28 TRINITY_DN1405_c0_g1_i7:153-1070(-)
MNPSFIFSFHNLSDTRSLCNDCIQKSLQYSVLLPAAEDIYRHFPKAISLNFKAKVSFNLLRDVELNAVLSMVVLIIKELRERFKGAEIISSEQMDKKMKFLKASKRISKSAYKELGINIELMKARSEEDKLSSIERLLELIPKHLKIAIMVFRICKDSKVIVTNLVEPLEDAIDTSGFLIAEQEIYMLFTESYLNSSNAEVASSYSEKLTCVSESLYKFGSDRSFTTSFDNGETDSMSEYYPKNSSIVKGETRQKEERCSYCKEVIEFGLYVDDKTCIHSSAETAHKIHLRCASERSSSERCLLD